MEKDKESFFSTKRGKRFVKFTIVGLTGWGINELFLFLFLKLLDRFFVDDLLFEIWRLDIEKVLIASMGSLAIVMVFTFVSNKLWTFKEQEKEFQTKAFIQFLQFVLVGLTGFALYSGVVYVLATLLHSNEYLATTIAFFVGLINNFIWNDLWTFNPKFKTRKEEEESLEEL